MKKTLFFAVIAIVLTGCGREDYQKKAWLNGYIEKDDEHYFTFVSLASDNRLREEFMIPCASVQVDKNVNIGDTVLVRKSESKHYLVEILPAPPRQAPQSGRSLVGMGIVITVVAFAVFFVALFFLVITFLHETVFKALE